MGGERAGAGLDIFFRAADKAIVEAKLDHYKRATWANF